MSNKSLYGRGDEAETLWCLILRDSGTIALCDWYLPPGSSLAEIESLGSELADVSAKADTIVVAGDLNVHHISWLRFSNGDTTRGRHLKDICDNYGLRPNFFKPTRGNYMLDLCLTNSSSISTEVLPRIADHHALLVNIPDAVETRVLEPRLIWKLGDANWLAIESHLKDFDWSILSQGTVDEALDVFTRELQTQMSMHIPSFMKYHRKDNLP